METKPKWTPLKVHGNRITGEPEPVDYLDLDFPTYEIGEETGQQWVAHTITIEHANRIVQCVNSHDALVEACRAALAALSQPATFPADIAAAKQWISDALAKVQP
jgi:hypothetical protein